jgi:hypothetical protein
MVLSKLKAAPAALRDRLPGGDDLSGPDAMPAAAPDVPDAVPTPELPDRDDLPETSSRDKLTLGLTLLSVVGALLAVVGLVGRAVVKRRRTATAVDIEVTDEDDETEPAGEAAEPEYPKVAPLVGMAALVAMRLFVNRLRGDD